MKIIYTESFKRASDLGTMPGFMPGGEMLSVVDLMSPKSVGNSSKIKKKKRKGRDVPSVHRPPGML